jgi:hypothetical protein
MTHWGYFINEEFSFHLLFERNQVSLIPNPPTMNKFFFFFLFTMGLLVSCNLLEKSDISSTEVGGDGNLTMNAVGTKISTNIQIAGAFYSASATVNSNVDGVVTMSVKTTLPKNNALTNLIPANMKDASGNLNSTMKYKNTSEGILDYTNKDGKPFVIVNYSSNVGDKYVFTKSDGTTITRTVTGKTTVDDYPVMGGSMLIKTMTVEQDSRIPGVNKIVYITNHKYALVAIVFYMNDGTSTKISLL